VVGGEWRLVPLRGSRVGGVVLGLGIRGVGPASCGAGLWVGVGGGRWGWGGGVGGGFGGGGGVPDWCHVLVCQDTGLLKGAWFNGGGV